MQIRIISCAVVLVLFSLLSHADTETTVDIKKTRNINVLAKTSAVVFSTRSNSLTVKKAYNLQKAFVKNSVAKGVDIVGFKASLTRPDAYRQYGLDEPVFGVLLQTPLTGETAQISREHTTSLMLEQEIAYKVSTVINSKLTMEQLVQHVSAIAPAIEIPDINFLTNDFNGLDIIANNAMAYKLAMGEWRPFISFADLDAVPVSLSCNGQILAQGKGNLSASGQAEALLWLINHIVEQGYSIQKDQILITGSLAQLTPVSPCLYQANFGNLGKLELRVTD